MLSSRFNHVDTSCTSCQKKMEEAKYLNCVLQDGQGSPFLERSIPKNIGWPPRRKNQSAILSECGKTLPSKIEKDHRWVLISGDPKTIAIRTPLPMRMCSNSGLDTVKKNHAFQHGHCTKVITRSAGRTKKTRRRSSKQICIQELTLGEESVIKKENSWSTQAHSMHIMSDSDLCPKEQDTFRKSKESFTIVTAHGSIKTTEEKLLSTSEIWTCLAPSNYWKISPADLSL